MCKNKCKTNIVCSVHDYIIFVRIGLKDRCFLIKLILVYETQVPMNSVQPTAGELFFAKCRVLLNFNNWETVARGCESLRTEGGIFNLKKKMKTASNKSCFTQAADD